jgi:exopolyphosphatase/guanosine-5'-triphosphate,3'-diphosphate pyrophosphatase
VARRGGELALALDRTHRLGALMRIAVVDIGTNSTRLLIADVDPQAGDVAELERRSTVTRLGQGVDATGQLAPEAMDRVFSTLCAYRQAIDEHEVERTTAVLTSAVRDAANGAAFTTQVQDAYGLTARTLSGEEEARMTFLGATAERDPAALSPVVVIDIGGGSTELVVGSGGQIDFFVSTQAGVVRHGERHIATDPPKPEELQALADDAASVFGAAVPEETRVTAKAAIGVGGTATSLAAIAQELEPYDPARVHGYHLPRASVQALLARLAQMTVEERRHVPGLHPDRAPTIVPGCVLMDEALRTFGLDEVEVSEHDILRGAAVARARETD